MRKPSAAGVCAFASSIDGVGPEGLEPEVPVDADEADQNPEDFHQKSGKVEVEEQRNDDQARANGVEKRVSKFIAAYFVQLQHQVCDHQHDHADISDKIQRAIA